MPATRLFKEGQYVKAREEFVKFLKQYPKTAYSDNAQFWIGETWYVEEKYERAIVEYEKVVKDYPSGDKVPYALLKQGMAFQKLGDKASARHRLPADRQEIPADQPGAGGEGQALGVEEEVDGRP